MCSSNYLNDTLGKKYPDVKFVTGIQYRHLLVVKHGNKHIDCAPPHDHPNEEWHKLMVKPILPEIEAMRVTSAVVIQPTF